MIREPIVAGQFYPASAPHLKALIETLAGRPAEADKEDVIGAVAPHAGYIFSGGVAARVFSRLAYPDTFIILGPNHTGRGKPFSIMTGGTWKTPLGDVGIDAALASRLEAGSDYLQVDAAAHQFEHSIEVQLPLLQFFGPAFRIVPIVLSPATGDVYREIGREIARAVKDSGRRVVIIASSDMTHYEPQELAQTKDSSAIDAILALDDEELLRRAEELDISMCGYAPVVSLITAARELGAETAELVDYRTSGDATADYSSVVGYAGIILKAAEMHSLVRLARRTIEVFVREGRVIRPPEDPAPEMTETAGVFVSLHKHGALRGCIGTFEPVRPTVAEEIIVNAISAATRDPRFPPVAPEELDEFDYSVDVLTGPRPVEDKDALDPKKHGLIVECGHRRGLLLPDLEGVDTVDQQVSICCRKAGISPDETLKLYCFEVNRYR